MRPVEMADEFSFDNIPISMAPRKHVTALYRSLEGDGSKFHTGEIYITHSSSSSASCSSASDSLAESNQFHNDTRSGESISSVSHVQPARLQLESVFEEDQMGGYQPVEEDDPQSYDLTVPCIESTPGKARYNLAERSLSLFSAEHFRTIVNNEQYLSAFSKFMRTYRPKSVYLLDRYMELLKALKALHFANAVVEEAYARAQGPGLDGIPSSTNPVLLKGIEKTFNLLVEDELPAFITYRYVEIASATITAKITARLSPHLQVASDGLAEVFCLTDPRRPDNPILFASEEFHRTTQYGMDYVLGRNCRFLQGPHTNPSSVRRLREAIKDNRHHQEVFLNYRRDGSPFVNLLMVSPLFDARGNVRYFIGAQVDVSCLLKDCTGLDSLYDLLQSKEHDEEIYDIHETGSSESRKNLECLSKLLNEQDISTILAHGGKMRRETERETQQSFANDFVTSQKPRLVIEERDSTDYVPLTNLAMKPLPRDPPLRVSESDHAGISGKLPGMYQNFILVRPYPSLRILFASPSQHFPGTLQSPFMSKIGGTEIVCEQIVTAFAHGRPITAKVRWITKFDQRGRKKWIYCTPMVGVGGQIGVWMVVIVDDEDSKLDQVSGTRPGIMAPPVMSRPDGSSARNTRDPNVAPFENHDEANDRSTPRKLPSRGQDNHASNPELKQVKRSVGESYENQGTETGHSVRRKPSSEVTDDPPNTSRSNNTDKPKPRKRGVSRFVDFAYHSKGSSSVQSFEI